MFVNMLTNKKSKKQIHPLEKLRFSGLHGETFAIFLRVSNNIGKIHYTLFKRFGLTEAQFFTLMSIYCSQDKQLTFSEISKILMVSRANVTGVIQRLEERKLIRRLDDESDRRLVYARLTKEGNRLLESIHPDYVAWISSLFADFNSQEMKVFYQYLKRLNLKS